MESNCKVEKHLIQYPDVFADIVNAYIFNGKEEVDPEELTATALHNKKRFTNSADDFFAEPNISHIKKSVQELRDGKGDSHELIE